jgi:hypothetical protein
MIPRSLAFLFVRRQSEELAAEHLIREHHDGRALSDILHDPYVTNRCTHEQLERLLDRPDVVRAVGDDLHTAREWLASGATPVPRGGEPGG